MKAVVTLQGFHGLAHFRLRCFFDPAISHPFSDSQAFAFGKTTGSGANQFVFETIRVSPPRVDSVALRRKNHAPWGSMINVLSRKFSQRLNPRPLAYRALALLAFASSHLGVAPKIMRRNSLLCYEES
jgi:hypothetical protein